MIENTDVLFAFGEMDEAYDQYEEWDDYFKGQVQVIQLSPAAARKFGRSEYLINFLKIAVTAVSNRLEIESVSIPDNEQLSQVLNEELWNYNQMRLELPSIFRKICSLGDGYLMVWGSADDGIDITYSGPRTTRIFYDPENPRRKLFASKRWYVESPLGKSMNYWRLNLYYNDRIEKYKTVEGTRKTSVAANWVPTMDEGDPSFPIPNLLPNGDPAGIPVFHLRVGDSPYGVPEHIEGIPVQNALNLHVSRQVGTVDYYTTPIMYALRDPDAALAGGTDDPADWDDAEQEATGELVADPVDVHNRDALSSAAGAVWYLAGVKEVGQFKPPDPDSFLKPMNFYLRTFGLLTDTPTHLFDPSGDPPSGESRKVAEMPLTKKSHMRQDTLDPGISSALQFGMKLLGYYDCPLPHISWAPVETVAGMEDLQMAQMKIDLGVPRREALLELGYTKEQVDTWEASGWADMPAQAVATIVANPNQGVINA